jgi:hypothetical protein
MECRRAQQKEALMTPTLLRLIIIALTIAAGLIGPARAGSDWQASRFAPHWFDQTVYQPDCLPADCSCDCRSERLCLPACVRQ